MNQLPDGAAIEAACGHIYAAMPPTPQYRWPLLCEALGTEVWLKHENHTPTGAFKIRSGLAYFGGLAEANRPAGVICATRGNHGQAVAFAAARFGLPTVIVVPHGNSREKNAAMRALGAELIEHGSDFQESLEYANGLARDRDLHFVPSFHPRLLAGTATIGYEFLKAVPDLDVVYVPIGMGSGICGMMAARATLGRSTRIVGVVSAHAEAYALSFETGRLQESPSSTALADGMACRTPAREALDMIRAGVDRILRVTDDEVAAAMRLLYEATHNVAEGAGAAALAAALQERGRLQGRRVGVLLTGGNVDRPVFAAVLDARLALP